MKKTNTDKSKKTSSVQDVKKAAAKAIIASLKDKENKLAIYDFVKEDKWKTLGCDSLKTATEEFPDMPSYSTMQRIHNAVDFQQTYLPDTVIGDFKESALRTISGNNCDDKIKKRVARMMINSGKSLNTLSAKNLAAFIEKAKEKSKIVLSPQHKTTALNLAEDMAADIIADDEYIDEIKVYMGEHTLSKKKRDVFFRVIGRKIANELKNQVGANF